MRLWRGSNRTATWIMVVALVAVLALPTMAAASTDLKSTSTIAYFSVIRDEEPFAGFTETDLKATSLIPYYSVLH